MFQVYWPRDYILGVNLTRKPPYETLKLGIQTFFIYHSRFYQTWHTMLKKCWKNSSPILVSENQRFHVSWAHCFIRPFCGIPVEVLPLEVSSLTNSTCGWTTVPTGSNLCRNTKKNHKGSTMVCMIFVAPSPQVHGLDPAWNLNQSWSVELCTL